MRREEGKDTMTGSDDDESTKAAEQTAAMASTGFAAQPGLPYMKYRHSCIHTYINAYKHISQVSL